MMWWSDNSGWSWFWMTLMMTVFWSLIAFAVVAVVRTLRAQDRNAGHGSTPSPEDVLTDRFARGDIDVDEYRRRSDELTAHHRT